MYVATNRRSVFDCHLSFTTAAKDFFFLCVCVFVQDDLLHLADCAANSSKTKDIQFGVTEKPQTNKKILFSI